MTHNPAIPTNGDSLLLATYEYRDESDRPLYRVCRYLPKSFRQQRWDEKLQTWIGGEGCMKDVPLVPYRLPEILALDKDRTLLVVDGEKDVDTAWAFGQPATCTPRGMDKWRDEFSERLKGRPIVVIIDRDGGKGKEQAEKVIESFARFEVKARAIELPGEGVKDLTDWVTKAHGTLKQLLDLMEEAIDWRKKFKVQPVNAVDLIPLIDAPIPYIVNPIIVRGSLTQIQGVPKGGKSAFSIYLSMCATECLWPYPQYMRAEGKLSVVYIAWEDPKIMMAKRLSLYAAGLGLDRMALPRNLTFLFGPDIFIEKADHLEALKAVVDEIKPDIMFIDTLSHIHLCDENASSEMKIPMKNLGRFATDSNIGVEIGRAHV